MQSDFPLESSYTSHLETSEDELIEYKLQIDEQYHEIPSKLGELIAGIHLVLVQKILKQLITRLPITQPSLKKINLINKLICLLNK